MTAWESLQSYLNHHSYQKERCKHLKKAIAWKYNILFILIILYLCKRPDYNQWRPLQHVSFALSVHFSCLKMRCQNATIMRQIFHKQRAKVSKSYSFNFPLWCYRVWKISLYNPGQIRALFFESNKEIPDHLTQGDFVSRKCITIYLCIFIYFFHVPKFSHIKHDVSIYFNGLLKLKSKFLYAVLETPKQRLE